MQFILETVKKLGDVEMIDTMIKDGLWDAFHGYHMGVTAKMLQLNFKLQEKIRMNLHFRHKKKKH